MHKKNLHNIKLLKFINLFILVMNFMNLAENDPNAVGDVYVNLSTPRGAMNGGKFKKIKS